MFIKTISADNYLIISSVQLYTLQEATQPYFPSCLLVREPGLFTLATAARYFIGACFIRLCRRAHDTPSVADMGTWPLTTCAVALRKHLISREPQRWPQNLQSSSVTSFLTPHFGAAELAPRRVGLGKAAAALFCRNRDFDAVVFCLENQNRRQIQRKAAQGPTKPTSSHS